ncbi:MAG: T9SS type A sorting domain-containing protein, partial [Gemmatimonadota bacterium]
TMEAIVEAEGQHYDGPPIFSNFGFEDNRDLDEGGYQVDSFSGEWTVLFADVNGISWDSDGWELPCFHELSDGSHTLYFVARDDAGNHVGHGGEWSWQFYKETPDSEPPTMEAIVEAEGQYYAETPVFSNFGFDDNEDLDDAWYQIDSYAEPWIPIFINAEGISWDDDWWEIPGFVSLDDGHHVIYFMADDAEGNMAGEHGEWSWQFYKDTIGPTIIYNTPEMGSSTEWYASNPGGVIDIDFGWGDNAPLDYAAYRVGNGQWYAVFIEDRSSDFTFEWGVHWDLLENGENAISLRVADKAGNTVTHAYEPDVQGFLFRKDTSAPEAPEIFSSTHPSESTWYSDRNPGIHWTIVSDLSGIAGFSSVLSNVPDLIPNETNQGPEDSQQYFDVDDGVWYFHCRAVDGAGNWGPTDHFSVRIDATDPDAPIDLAVEPEGWTHSHVFTLTWTDPEDISGVAGGYFRLNELPSSDTDGEFITENPIVVEIAGEGEHMFYLWLQDNAGNVNETNIASVPLFYDASGPVAGTISIEDGAQTTDTLIVTLTGLGAQDALSGIAAMQFSNDGETWSPPEPYAEEQAEWDLVSYGGNAEPGVKTVYVRYIDAAGNESEIFQSTIVYSPILRITTAQLKKAVIEAPYSANLEAVGGMGHYTWSVVSGSLPEGLSLNAMTGDIFGTPEAYDPFTAYFTVQVVDSVHASDTQDLSLTVCERQQGDANGDGAIDILDGLDVVNMILNDSCAIMEGDHCWSGDCNGDGSVNILDVLCIVNHILGGGGTAKTVSSSTPVDVTVAEKNDELQENRNMIISIGSSVPVGGVQLRLCPVEGSGCFGAPVLTDRSRQMNVAWATRDGIVTILLYGFNGGNISPGEEPILLIPVSGSTAVRFEEVIIADMIGRSLDVNTGSEISKGAPVAPESSALFANYPNPFNPSTAIRYQIPQGRVPALTRLRVFNVLGQEMLTLVDEVQEPGCYTVTWNGRDSSGNMVPSGIYFYRIEVSDFVDTKRMIYMK